jgi:hypothetical protein
LEKYPSKVDWIPVEPLPADIMIPPNLLVDYRVVDRDKGVNPQNIVYAEDGSNVVPSIKEKFTGDLKNVYRVVIKQRAADKGAATNIAFVLTVGVQLGLNPNSRLKFDCYVRSQDYDWLDASKFSKYEPWKKIKVFISRNLPTFTGDTPYVANDFPYGSPNRNETAEYQISDNDKGFNASITGTWTHHEWDLSAYSGGHYRVLRIQFGADGAPWGLPGDKILTYYIANLRWSK